MSTPIHMLGISGSLRKGSLNTALLRNAAGLLPEGVTLEIYDIGDIPLYNGDIDVEGGPAPVRRFRQHIAAADALLIAAPEYNYSFSGVLKNALDWASRPPQPPLNDKPLAIIGAGAGVGASRAQLHLRQVAVYTNMHPLNKPEVQIARAWEKFDSEGRLTDPADREQLRALVEALAVWTRRLRREN